MAKEVMIVTPEDIKNHITLSAAAADTLKWMIANAGVEMDEEQQAEFIQQRELRINEIRECWELKAWCEKTADCIKEAAKHTFNMGTLEQMPKNVSWKKGGGKYVFKPGAGAIIAKSLISRHLTTSEKLFNAVSPSAMAEAANMKIEGLIEKFPDTIDYNPNSPSLTIK